MHISFAKVATAVVVLTCTATSSASIVTWGLAQNTTSPLDISTIGTSVLAFNGGDSSPTVNGVLFSTANPLGSKFVGALNGGSTGDASLNQLLNEFSFGGGTPTSIDLGSFIMGNTYEVQVFFTDQRSFAVNRVMTFGSFDGTTSGPTVDLEADPNNASTSPFGQFAIGAFVADGSDPDLTLIAGTNPLFPNTHITAWQVRLIGTAAAIPEPSMFLVWTGLACCAGVVYKKRRSSSSSAA